MNEEQTNQSVGTLESSAELVTWSEFLESHPVGSVQKVAGYFRRNEKLPNVYMPFAHETPVLRLHCAECDGIRNFEGLWRHHRGFEKPGILEDFLKYTCRDCQKGEKTYCVVICPIDNAGNGEAIKIGEIPELYVQVPKSLEKLLGDDFAIFRRGLICEKRGLGIGAFTYYRRVVESQKSHLISEILRVAQKLNAPKEVLTTLGQAASEKQFARAVDAVKDVIPESLLIDSHNPLKLLHNSLSIGVHSETDEDCLKVAHSIRLVLADLSEKLGLALADQRDLKAAVSDLFKFTSNANQKARPSQGTGSDD